MGSVINDSNVEAIKMAFTNKNDINILQPSDPVVVGAGAGDDVYVLALSRLSPGQQVQISDTQGNNSLQLIGGLTISSSIVAANAVQLTLNNGSVVTVLGADSFGYEIGGNPLTNIAGAFQNYSLFATSVLGVASVPISGTLQGKPNVIVPNEVSTIPDTTAPTVLSFSPSDGATGITVNSNIVLTFSEAILRGTGSIQLRSGSATGTVVETFDASSSRLSISGSALTVDPTSDLLTNTQYFLTFAPGAIKDLAGNSYAGTTSYDFKTVNDTIAPTISQFSPLDGATGVDTSSNITLTFSEAILPGTGLIQLRSGSATGTVVESFDAASSHRLSIAGSTLVVDPTSNLSADTQYFLTIASGAVKDLAGNSYVGTATYDFKTAPANGAFDIVINYTGSSTYKKYFDLAEAMWEKVIIGDLPDTGGIDDLLIYAGVQNIDGEYGILGQAGPRYLRGSSSNYLPFIGEMEFDSSDIAYMENNGTLTAVIAHEMGHVLGFGTLWDDLGLNKVFGQYTGSNALAEYRTLSGKNNATYVPLETEGQSGTVNSHWSEAVFDRELMTGYSESSPPLPLSRLTIAAMKDLGYQVNFDAAEAFTLLLTGANADMDFIGLVGVGEGSALIL